MEVKKRFSIELSSGSESDGTRAILKVPSCIQNYSWDCGLACSSMVLKYLGQTTQRVYTSDLEALQCGESIWTIDLAALLHRYNICHKLCTITLGVDKQYSKQSFYSGRFSTDEERVSKLFEEAAMLGLTVELRSVSEDDMISHIQSGNIFIVLVDWHQLECIWCGTSRCQSSCMPACLRSRCCSGFQGHYVVVCGYDRKKRRIFYKNPSYDEGERYKGHHGPLVFNSSGPVVQIPCKQGRTITDLCCSRMDRFDNARKSYGTDEDVLFVYKDGVP